tara:strand:- start:332 stop:571 length:240 start_codon:yes stop_codon:yes gene_type:complete
LSLGSSENLIPIYLNIGERIMTPGVPIAHANIQALTHSWIIGGNVSVLIAVTKKLTIPVITVATKMPPMIVPTVYLNII